jgi:hypothetical protein
MAAVVALTLVGSLIQIGALGLKDIGLSIRLSNLGLGVLAGLALLAATKLRGEARHLRVAVMAAVATAVVSLVAPSIVSLIVMGSSIGVCWASSLADLLPKASLSERLLMALGVLGPLMAGAPFLAVLVGFLLPYPMVGLTAAVMMIASISGGAVLKARSKAW